MSIGSLFSEGFLLILVGRNACELLENHGEIATASEANVYGYGLYGYIGIFRRRQAPARLLYAVLRQKGAEIDAEHFVYDTRSRPGVYPEHGCHLLEREILLIDFGRCLHKLSYHACQFLCLFVRPGGLLHPA